MHSSPTHPPILILFTHTTMMFCAPLNDIIYLCMCFPQLHIIPTLTCTGTSIPEGCSLTAGLQLTSQTGPVFLQTQSTAGL